MRITFRGVAIVLTCAAAIAVVTLIVVIFAAGLSRSSGRNENPDQSVSNPVGSHSGTETEAVPETPDAPETTDDDPIRQNPEDTSASESPPSTGPETNDTENGDPSPEPGADTETPAPEGNGAIGAPPDGIFASNEDIQSAVDRVSEKYGAVGVQVAVIRNGEIVGTYVYGYAVKGTRPMASDTKIRIASLSKVTLATLIMRLSEQGLIDVDADIGEYWGAEVRNPNHRDTPITMRQMLSHTSSMRVYEYGFAADGELIKRRFLDGSCFIGAVPGAIGSWDYNNYAFAALGVTVEVAAGETVNSLAARYLFGPLGIDAAFGSGSIEDTDNLAVLYLNGGGVGRSIDAQLQSPGSTFPGERGDEFPGGVTISAYDYAKLVAVLANRGEYGGVRVLTPESVALMESPQGRIGGFDQCLPMRRRTNLFGEEEIFYHTGSNFGVFSLASYNPNNGNGVVVLTSGANGVRDSNDIYSICAEISDYIYKYMQNEN